MKRFRAFQLVVICFFLLGPALSAEAEQPALGSILEKCSAAYSAVKDYTCTLHRKEFLPNGTYKEQRNILMKARKPNQYYMKWTEGEASEFEVIYVEGKYNNKLMVHGGWLLRFFTIGLDPKGYLVMRENRHTIYEADIGRILALFEENCRKASSDREAEIVLEKEEMLDGRKTWRYKAVFPPGKGYYGHLIYVNLDQALYLPIKITVYGWKMELLEDYYFADLKLNSGLTETDFDIKNPAYKFK